MNANEMEEKKQKNKEECNSQPANQFLYRLSQSWRPTRICKLRGQPCNNAERKSAVRVSQTEAAINLNQSRHDFELVHATPLALVPSVTRSPPRSTLFPHSIPPSAHSISSIPPPSIVRHPYRPLPPSPLLPPLSSPAPSPGFPPHPRYIPGHCRVLIDLSWTPATPRVARNRSCRGFACRPPPPSQNNLYFVCSVL